VRHLTYLFVLAGCLVAAAPLEFLLGLRVRTQTWRLVLTLVPVVIVFVAWDVYAIARHQWSYDRAQTSGVLLPGRLPLEELLFFLVIPVCAVLTIEAVRKVTGWSLIDDAQPRTEPGEPAERPVSR
jgi:lycopene cyclase domain-containing protein